MLMKLLYYGLLAAAFALLDSHSVRQRMSVASSLAVDAVAIPATSPIVLDGKLNEEIWQQAPAVVDFLQRDPDEGQPPTMRTEARIAYDDAALYVAVRAFDTEAAQDRRHPDAARSALALRLDSHRRRLVLRSSDRPTSSASTRSA